MSGSTDTKALKIAEEIERAHHQGEKFTRLTGELAPLNLEEAYSAQQALQRLRADGPRGLVGGRKIALASKVQQELCGIDHPIAGAIYQNEIYSTPASLQFSNYHGLGIEYEIALTLDQDTVMGKHYSQEEVTALVRNIYPAFEMIIDRGADYASIDVLTMIADNAWCAGIVLGPDILPMLNSGGVTQINDLQTTLRWNSETETASTSATDPLGTLTWVVNHLSAVGEQLLAGQPVITGSVMKTRYPAQGDSVTFSIDGYAEVALSLV
ncbi:MAG: hypothetical protein KTR32_06865 [Granulosicoccus sp.]|nr:hypothetical protein [Granulosicoccus sp.]